VRVHDNEDQQMSAVRSDTDANLAVAPIGDPELKHEELALYERVVQRDESALLECFDRIGDAVYCIALLCTEGRASAEALTTAVFVRFWQHPQAFPPSDGPLALQLVRQMTADLADTSHT
jgi:hypothetical protein